MQSNGKLKNQLCFEIEIRVSFTFSLTQEKVGKSD
jgi:hypothetical protein